MKVTMLLSRLDQTGMTTHTLDLAESLFRKGVDITLIVGRDNKCPQFLIERLYNTGARVKYFKCPDRSSLYSKIISCISLIYNIITTGGVIHIQSPYLSWIPWILGKKFISTLHVNDLVKCFYYKNATHLIAISEETKSYAKEIFGYKDNDITIVNHGVNQEFAKKLTLQQIRRERARLNLPTDKLLLTIVGSIEPRKGHDILLNAVARLPESVKNKVHVVILGSDKNANNANSLWLKQIIEETNTQSLLSHFEYQDSKLFYKISDIFILPSWLEGFPVVVIEAMLSGNLCIRSDAEGVHEQIKHGETGFIFHKGEVDELKNILERVINDDSMRKQVAQNGYRYALQHFTSDVMAQNTINIYRKLLNK